jgi:uncharacterized protein (DUF302 family)
MTRTEQLKKATRRAAHAAGEMLKDAKDHLQRTARNRRIKRAVRETAAAAVSVGAAAATTVLIEEVAHRVRRREIARFRDKESALGITIELDRGVPQAIEAVTEALRAEEFGILTRIDVGQVMKDKLNRPFRPYVILGACNPALAHRALSHRAEVGLVLPCSVTVEASPRGGSTVRIANPKTMLGIDGLGGDPALNAIAREAGERLQRVAAALH